MRKEMIEVVAMMDDKGKIMLRNLHFFHTQSYLRDILQVFHL